MSRARCYAISAENPRWIPDRRGRAEIVGNGSDVDPWGQPAASVRPRVGSHSRPNLGVAWVSGQGWQDPTTKPAGLFPVISRLRALSGNSNGREIPVSGHEVASHMFSNYLVELRFFLETASRGTLYAGIFPV